MPGELHPEEPGGDGTAPSSAAGRPRQMARDELADVAVGGDAAPSRRVAARSSARRDARCGARSRRRRPPNSGPSGVSIAARRPATRRPASTGHGFHRSRSSMRRAELVVEVGGGEVDALEHLVHERAELRPPGMAPSGRSERRCRRPRRLPAVSPASSGSSAAPESPRLSSSGSSYGTAARSLIALKDQRRSPGTALRSSTRELESTRERGDSSSAPAPGATVGRRRTGTSGTASPSGANTGRRKLARLVVGWQRHPLCHEQVGVDLSRAPGEQHPGEPGDLARLARLHQNSVSCSARVSAT